MLFLTVGGSAGMAEYILRGRVRREEGRTGTAEKRVLGSSSIESVREKRPEDGRWGETEGWEMEVVPVRQDTGKLTAAGGSVYGRKGGRMEDGERLRRWKWERSYRYDRIEATGTPGLNRSRRWVCTGEKGGGRRMGRGLSYAEVS